jgi:SAM-dependent methyltransferase
MILLALASSAQVAHQNHPPRDADEYAKVLESPGRDEWQKPDEVVSALKLTRQEVVADLGAGSGYFTRRLAKRSKLVLAVDIDAKLLELNRKSSPPNVNTILATEKDPMLAPASVDVIFVCNVWHHIQHRLLYASSLGAALRPGGRIVIIDFYKRPLPVGPPETMKLDPTQVIAEFSAAGIDLTARHGFLPYQYFLEFSKRK